MFKVRAMSVEDYPFALRLANTMNWNMTRQDLEFIASLEPEGCFVLVKGTERIGMVTCISYRSGGWFGNLIVKEEEREKGAGSLLVKKVVDYFHSKGIQTIGLYAYPHLTKFYADLGFKRHEDFAVMQATPSLNKKENLPDILAQNIDQVVEFDTRCFGWDRRKLLEAIVLIKGNFGCLFQKQEEIVGYAVAKVYGNMAEVGPLVCKPDCLNEAECLIECILGRLEGLNVYLCLPKNEKAFISILTHLGFTEKFSVTNMLLGEIKKKNCIYVAESLERG